MHNILAVNPGSTTTKVALFEEEAEVSGDVFRHDAADLRSCGKLWDQLELRWQAVYGWTSRNVRELSAVVAAGGLFRPLVRGTYAVNERMLSDARANLQGEHVSVDEFEPLARYSGRPLIERRSLSHAINIYATARRAAAQLGLSMPQSSLIIAHLGGGISTDPERDRSGACARQCESQGGGTRRHRVGSDQYAVHHGCGGAVPDERAGPDPRMRGVWPFSTG
jgi:butyrate kinase